MSSDRFDLYFIGELEDGYFADFVKVDMARLFKVDLERIEPYFSGEPQPIKLNVDNATASKYQQALAQIGAKLVTVPQGKPVKGTSKEPSSAKPESSSTLAQGSAPSGDWRLLPPGSVIGEHKEVKPVSIDISNLSLAEVGVDLVENPSRPEPVNVDISGLSLDAPGVNLVDQSSKPAPKPPDTSHIKLKGD